MIIKLKPAIVPSLLELCIITLKIKFNFDGTLIKNLHHLLRIPHDCVAKIRDIHSLFNMRHKIIYDTALKWNQITDNTYVFMKYEIKLTYYFDKYIFKTCSRIINKEILKTITFSYCNKCNIVVDNPLHDDMCPHCYGFIYFNQSKNPSTVILWDQIKNDIKNNYIKFDSNIF